MNTEYNILIAEFLGRRGKENKYLFTWRGIDQLTPNVWLEADDLVFHKNWNWLIFALKEFEKRIAKGWSVELFIDFIEARNEALISLNQSKLYEILVENIKWYNRNK